VRRALPSIVVTALLAGLLAAGVLAAPSDEPRSARAGAGGGGPFSLLRERPEDYDPLFDKFQAAPAPTSEPALVPLDDLAPEPPAAAPSRAVGKPWKGRLRNGVELPREGQSFFTLDSALRTTPSRDWRRFATAATVSRTLAVLDDFHAAHPEGPRLGVGDLSLPRGGPFGPEYGGLGHRSHQNGQDVDVYYPRRDRRELEPAKPRQVDRRLSQDLVDRFVAAGAELVFVGPSLDLKGPRGVVQPLAHHDNHVHVRWPKR
jgi:murein endopeptidase